MGDFSVGDTFQLKFKRATVTSYDTKNDTNEYHVAYERMSETISFHFIH